MLYMHVMLLLVCTYGEVGTSPVSARTRFSYAHHVGFSVNSHARLFKNCLSQRFLLRCCQRLNTISALIEKLQLIRLAKLFKDREEQLHSRDYRIALFP